jgi:hypothetical protein
MTNYNDGKWHGWNGGECPVHPKSKINVKWSCNGVETGEATAYSFSAHWTGHVICAFRVVEEHKEPREFWIDPERCISVPSYHAGFIHVREVLDNE